jgi:hypothetical protein
MPALKTDGLKPIEAEPGEVFKDEIGEALTATRGIDILDAQEERAADTFCGMERKEGGEGMAEMEFTVRAWRKAVGRGRHGGIDRRFSVHVAIVTA